MCGGCPGKDTCHIANTLVDLLAIGQSLRPAGDYDGPHGALFGRGSLGCRVVVAHQQAVKGAQHHERIGLGGGAAQWQPEARDLGCVS